MSVTHGQFSFDGINFYVTSAGTHFHQRASHAELRALFDTSMPDRSHRPDYPAHWYSAQLLHYGLPVSDKKVVAKMRLLDALQDGTLKVPGEMVKLEEDLKRQWEKQDLEKRLQNAGLAFSGSTDGLERTTRTTGVENAHRAQLGSPFRAVSSNDDTMSSSSTSRKRSTNASCLQTARKKSKPEKPAVKSTQQPRNGREMPGISVNVHLNTQIPNSPREKVEMNHLPGSGLPSNMDTVPDWVLTPPEHDSQILSQARMNRAPPDTKRQNFGYDGTDRSQTLSSPPNHSSPSTRNMKEFVSLGLINGEYDIFSPDFEYSPEGALQRFNLALCLNGQEIWGQYDFGMLYGMLHMRQRPMRASQTKHVFEWRGYDVAGNQDVKSGGEGWIRFLGDGEIEGEIHSSGWLRFEGQRISGQNTSRPRNLDYLKSEWDELD